MRDGRQSEVDFLHHWAVAWLKLLGKSSLKEKETKRKKKRKEKKRNLAIQICWRQGI